MNIWRDGDPVEKPSGDILVLGEAPATDDQRVPLRVTWCRKRLIDDHDIVGTNGSRIWTDHLFDVANVFDDVQERQTGGGFKFPLARAATTLDLQSLLGYTGVVTLGRSFEALRRAIKAFGWIERLMEHEPRWGEPTTIIQPGGRNTQVLRLPHPSGACRLWNDVKRREAIYKNYRSFVGFEEPPMTSLAKAIEKARGRPEPVPLRGYA